MLLTTDFFFGEIVKKEELKYHEKSIFASSSESGLPQVPNWVIWFTVENNPHYKCEKCKRLGIPMMKVASEL